LSQSRHGGQGAKDPIELGVLGNGGLDKEGALGGIDATCQQRGGHGEDVLSQKRRIVGHGNRVQIHNTHGDIVTSILQLHPFAHGAEIITQMQGTRRLDATKDFPRPAGVMLGWGNILESCVM